MEWTLASLPGLGGLDPGLGPDPGSETNHAHGLGDANTRAASTHP